MIISASRRTDIPAFYSEWFINRIRAGYCTVPNPFNPKQVLRVNLSPEKVDVIVFWTRNPRPLFPYLAELDDRGYRYYFHYTLMANPRVIEPKTPPTKTAIKIFQELAGRVGPSRLIWRYDPIVFTPITTPAFHEEKFSEIANTLKGYTYRSVISLVDYYYKAKKRFAEMASLGATLQMPATVESETIERLVRRFVAAAQENGLQIASCAEDIDLTGYGILPGKCMDDRYIRQVFGIDVTHEKDPSQRKSCGCVVSKDIGMYESCLFGCRYCYATGSFERARLNYVSHDPLSPSLIGWHESGQS
jgi:hypothetical protein